MPIMPGIIQTVLGTGQEGWGGDGGPALQAAYETPYMCAFDPQGHLFVCMGQHHRIRRVDARTGIITLVAGTGERGYSGDGGPALQATFNMPYALTVDTNGDIYVAERGTPIVRKIDGQTGLVTTLAGTGEKGYGGDGGPATEALLREPNDVCLDGQGGLLIADVQDQRIRRVELRTGRIETFAGTGEKSRAGDGGPATAAGFARPNGCGIDAAGHLYIADTHNHRVRVVGLSPA